MSEWKRKLYPIMVSDDGKVAQQLARGLSDNLWGIRYECGVGFRITHLPTGHLISPVFFSRLRSAVAFCERVTPLADWEGMTVTTAQPLQEKLRPEMTRLLRQYRHAWLREGGGRYWIDWNEAA